MTRPLRIEVPFGIHHAMSRGIEKRTIFRDRVDFESFLLELAGCVARFEWRCLAYCLMHNHFHLLIQTPKANLAPGMRDLKSGYAFGFNRRHGRGGPLFEGRYKSQLVQDNEYLLAAARYIALNPVRAGLTRRAEEWEWSSFRSLHAGHATRLVDPAPLWAIHPGSQDDARRAFIGLVADGTGLPAYDPEEPMCGSRAFIEAHAPDVPPEQPVARAAWEQARPPLAELVESLPREKAMHEARHVHRYTLREIGAAFACSTETVRRRLKMWDVRT